MCHDRTSHKVVLSCLFGCRSEASKLSCVTLFGFDRCVSYQRTSTLDELSFK
jgi:hypothetical protein